MAIVSCKDPRVASLLEGRVPGKGFPADLVREARRKVRQLNRATELGDLRIPLGNRLEKLVGDREGQHSIRINDQFRLCFRWTPEGAVDVEIVDYHGER